MRLVHNSIYLNSGPGLEGTEHLHMIEPVTEGKRWTIALWLTESQKLQNELFQCDRSGAVLDPVVGEVCQPQGRQHVEDVNSASGGAKWHHNRRILQDPHAFGPGRRGPWQKESYTLVEPGHRSFPPSGVHYQQQDELEQDDSQDDADGQDGQHDEM